MGTVRSSPASATVAVPASVCRRAQLRQRLSDSPRAAGGVVGVGDGTHHDDSFGTRRDHLVDVGQIDAADREPWPAGSEAGRIADEFGADRGTTGFGRRRPDGAHAEVGEMLRLRGRRHLVGGMRGQADVRPGLHDVPRQLSGKVLLPEMEHGSAGEGGDIGAVVDRPQRPVARRGLGEDLQKRQLLASLERLVPQLDDVDSAGEGGVDELGEVALTVAGVGAEVELGIGDRHALSVAADAPQGRRAGADAVVIGAGVVGLSIAWRIARSGRSVRVIDPAAAQGATFAAAGMLAPVSEYHYQEDALLPLLRASAQLYPQVIRDLGVSEESVGYRRSATMLVGIDHGDRQALADLHLAHRRAELAASPMPVREAREREPLLGPRVTCVYDIPGDHQIDPRLLAARLQRELEAVRGRAETVIIPHRAVGLLRRDPDDPDAAVTGVRLDDATTIAADEVIVANGMGAATLEGIPHGVTLPLRPVFGDILRLRAPQSLLSSMQSTVRAIVRGENVYLVPRDDGTIVVGATQREDGLDGLSAAGVHRLLRDAQTVFPAVGEMQLIEATARARPATPDNAPLIGRMRGRSAPSIAGLVVATGFFRHGVLLAPLAADIVTSILDGDAGQSWTTFRPDRFTRTDAADFAAAKEH